MWGGGGRWAEIRHEETRQTLQLSKNSIGINYSKATCKFHFAQEHGIYIMDKIPCDPVLLIAFTCKLEYSMHIFTLSALFVTDHCGRLYLWQQLLSCDMKKVIKNHPFCIRY